MITILQYYCTTLTSRVNCAEHLSNEKRRWLQRRTRIRVLSAQQVRPRGSSAGGTHRRPGRRLLSRVLHSWRRWTLSVRGIIIIVVVRALGRDRTPNRATSTSIRNGRGTNMRTSQPPPTRARRACV